MNKLTKKQLIIGALIFLFVINLAALGTIIYQNYKYQRPGRDFFLDNERNEQFHRNRDWRNSRRPGMKQEHPRRQGFDFYMRRKMDLSDEQFDTFRELKRENARRIRKIVDSLQVKRSEMKVELAKPEPDEEKLRQIASEIGHLHKELKLSTIDHFMTMKKVLNPEQMEHFNEMIQKMPGNNRHMDSERRDHRRFKPMN